MSTKGVKRQYARGRHALAECQRSGQKMRYRDLVEDGHIPGLLVHPDWWEPKHPQEIPVNVTDPIALYRPAPEISVPAGYGNPENFSGEIVITPISPSSPAIGVLAADLQDGDRQVALVDAVTYSIYEYLLIELDGGGIYYLSKTSMGSDSPTFIIPFSTPFDTIYGTASAGNSVHIEVS